MDSDNVTETKPSLRAAAEALVRSRLDVLDTLAERSEAAVRLRSQLADAEAAEQAALKACLDQGWSKGELRQLGVEVGATTGAKRRPRKRASRDGS